jgi:hypothetical protein
MSLRFELCSCQKHGRFVGDRGLPVEVGSREMANAMINDAAKNGVLGPGDLKAIEKAKAESMLVPKDDWIEEGLRQRIHLWNLAAATTNDPDGFARTDFHAYHHLVDGFGQDDAQPD